MQSIDGQFLKSSPTSSTDPLHVAGELLLQLLLLLQSHEAGSRLHSLLLLRKLPGFERTMTKTLSFMAACAIFFSMVSHRSFLGQKGLIMRICLLNIPLLHPFRGKNYRLLTRVSPEILIVTNLVHQLSKIVAVVLNRKLNDTNWCGISFQTLARHFSTDNCTTTGLASQG